MTSGPHIPTRFDATLVLLVLAVVGFIAALILG
jgi:hypothetical protein